MQVHYIIQERIDGTTFDSESWCNLPDESRKLTTSRLCEQLRLLRATPSPGYYGRVNHQSWYPGAALFNTSLAKPCGPYDTYKDFCDAAVTAAAVCAALHPFNRNQDELIPEYVDFLTRYQTELQSWKGNQPTFTHMDPALQNIMIQRIDNWSDKEDWKVTFIDFDHSGWYPAWMQAIAFKNCCGIFDPVKAAELEQAIVDCCGQLCEQPCEQQDAMFDDLYNAFSIIVN
ncbi:hypothetical protein NX059_006765 [Plenodomus lindquistii]|nr:hypothetical protein NX059_006765 [Plenodomus lindquistii]